MRGGEKMYDEFIRIFKANNIPFEEFIFDKENGNYKEIKLEMGAFFFDEYDEFTKALDNS